MGTLVGDPHNGSGAAGGLNMTSVDSMAVANSWASMESPAMATNDRAFAGLEDGMHGARTDRDRQGKLSV